MVEDLVIVGAGRVAADIVWLVDELNRVEPRWRLRGFLDDDPSRLETSVEGLPVLGPISAAAELTDARFVVAIAHYRRPPVRADVVARLNVPRERYVTLVHPTASVAPTARIGVGSLLFGNTLVCSGADIGDHVFIAPFGVVSHHVTIEDGATMAVGATLCGGSRLGAYAYLGARSVVKDGINIGGGAVVGIGSVVVRDVVKRTVVFGNPARVALGKGVEL